MNYPELKDLYPKFIDNLLSMTDLIMETNEYKSITYETMDLRFILVPHIQELIEDDLKKLYRIEKLKGLI